MIHFSITSAMLCLNFHKFSLSILARNLVHVLKAVAILTGGYWHFYAPEAINIKPTWYTDQEFWICLFPIINQNIFSKFSDFRFVISTDYSLEVEICEWASFIFFI